MKKIVVAILVITVSFGLSSCKTSYNKANKNKSIQGLWLGSYTVDGIYTIAKQTCNLILKPDGTLIYESDGAGTNHLTTGKWTLQDDILTCKCTCVYGLESNIGAEQIYTFRINQKTGELTEGVWKDISPRSGSGTFILTKAK